MNSNTLNIFSSVRLTTALIINRVVNVEIKVSLTIVIIQVLYHKYQALSILSVLRYIGVRDLRFSVKCGVHVFPPLRQNTYTQHYISYRCINSLALFPRSTVLRWSYGRPILLATGCISYIFSPLYTKQYEHL